MPQLTLHLSVRIFFIFPLFTSIAGILVSCGFDRDALVWNPMVNHVLYRLKGHYSSLIGVHTIENTPQCMKFMLYSAD